MAQWLISGVAEQTGVPAATIRYYEEIGLLRATSRTAAGYRRYSDTAIDELRFIRKAQALGFSLDEVGQILQLSRAGEAPCARVLELTSHHVAALDEGIRDLQRLRDRLDRELAKWTAQGTATCAGLCRFIANADAAPVPTALPPARSQSRAAVRRSRLRSSSAKRR